MSRALIIAGLAMAALGVLWPFLGRIGLGRLPGDILIVRENVRFYAPLGTCLLISVAVSLLLWLINR
jgi:hypothetical protein